MMRSFTRKMFLVATLFAMGCMNLLAETVSIKDAQEAYSADDVVAVAGTVVGVYNRGCLVTDGTGYILYYNGATVGYAVGDQLTIEGALATYGGFNQFTSTATVIKTGTDASFAQPTPAVFAGADMDSYLNAPSFKYIQVTGTLAVSGSYYNLTVEGAQTAVGSLSYPIENYASYDGKEVTVTGYAIGVSSSKYFNIMVISLTSDEAPIVIEYEKVDVATAAAGEAGTNYEVDGTVSATYERGFLLTDATGSILVYTGAVTDYSIGDIINLKGAVSAYAGLNQFTSTAIITKTGSETFTQPAPTVFDAAALDAYLTAPVVKYATYTGVLTISGTYYNIAVEGTTTAVGSISYPSAAMVPDTLSGKSVTVTGYLIGVSSSTYANTMLVKIEVAGEGSGEEGGGDEGEEITGTNLLENGSFETWQGDTLPAEWYANSSSNVTLEKSSDAKEGSTSVLLTGASSNKRLTTKPYSLKAGTYNFAVHAKAAEGKTAGKIRLGYVSFKDDGTVNSNTYKYILDATEVTSNWKQYSGEITFDTDTTVTLVIMISAGADTYYLADNAMLVASDDEEEPVVGEPQTVSTAVAAASGDECYVKGTVAATYARGFLLTDETGSILVYLNAATTNAVGDVVTVKGPISVYAGLNQFTAAAVVETVSTGTFTYPEPVAMDAAAMDAYINNVTVNYVTYTGVLTVSGNYNNVIVEGATAQGSLAYPLESYADNNKDTIKVTGYTIGVSSGKYVNTMVTGIEVVGEYQEPEVTEIKISEAMAAEAGTTCLVRGLVAATYARGFLLTDESASILVYLNAAPTNNVGDVVTVKGDISQYNGLNQFPATSIVTTVTTSTSYTYPTPVALDGAGLDACLTDVKIEYVTYTGVLKVDGNYYNVEVEGAATAIGRITYPVDSYAENDLDTITVTGFTIGVGSSKYVNTMVVKFEVIGDYDDGEPSATVGDGSKENPYTVADVITLDNSVAGPFWVTGTVGGTYANGGVLTTADWSQATNLALVDDEGNVIPVQLPSESAAPSVRAALNLVDNPALFGETVKVYGTLENYFSVPAVKNVTDYDLSLTGIQNIAEKAAYSLNGNVISGKGAVEVFNVTGQRVGKFVDGSITLERGIYMIKSNNKVSKVFVK